MKNKLKMFVSASFVLCSTMAMADQPDFRDAAESVLTLSATQAMSTDEAKAESKQSEILNTSSVLADENTQPLDNSWSGWFKNKASGARDAVLGTSQKVATVGGKVLGAAYVFGVTHTAQEVTGNYFEAWKMDAMNAAYNATTSMTKKALIAGNWANACEQAYKRGAFVGSIAGHFVGGVSFDMMGRAWSGEIFSKEMLIDCAQRASETGIKQLLLNATETFVVNSAEFVLRSYVVNPLIWGGTTAVFGPAAPVLALPILGMLNNSQVVDAGVHFGYNVAASATYKVGSFAARTGYKATSYVASKISSWWCGPQSEAAVIDAAAVAQAA